MKRIFYILSLLIISSGCSDFLEVDPLHTPDENTFWKTQGDAQAALNQLYNYLPNADRWWTESYSDNSIMTNAWGERGLGEIKQGGLAATTGHLQAGYGWSEWRYDHVRQLIYFLQNIEKVSSGSEDELKRMKGEARFILAMKYYRMTRLWGDLPLIKENVISIEESEALERSPQIEVVDYIFENIDKALENLPEGQDKSGRIFKDAALMLKADVAIWAASWSKFHGKAVSTLAEDQLWDMAVDACQEIIDGGNYGLHPDIVNLFHSETNNTDSETILARQYVKDEITHMINLLGTPGGVSLRGGGWAGFSAPRNLVDTYECVDGKSIYESPLYDVQNPWENRDKRLTSWFLLPGEPVLRQDGSFSPFQSHPSYGNLEAIGGEGGGGRSGYWGVKYVEMDTYQGYGYQNWIIYRYGETLLFLAEALNEIDPSDARIVEAINPIRERAGLPPVDALLGNQTAMRDLIRHERRVELVNEEKRYYDLLRWKEAENAMNPAGNVLYGINLTAEDYNQKLGDWTVEKVVAEPIKFDPTKNYLWPVPQDVIDRNSKISQNPNY
ncbi:RagB/SusD family nutrient uptake outer membrane protein [Echinicola sediminis]